MNKKIVLLGDAFSGKTTWVRKILANGNPTNDHNYNPTLGVEVWPIDFNNFAFNVWDCAGQDKYGGLRDGYYLMGDVAILFHNVTQDGRPALKNTSSDWVRDWKRVNENSPIIHVFSKADLLSDNEKQEILAKYPDAIFISSKNDDVFGPLEKISTLKKITIH